ncbi:diadenylate cyclase CdaA [Desulfohalobiaceae bacterium Ax17]|jgi:uncharacterized protein (TIGR00159 family)|uniref:diadenylate cyclase CdaA n=1 Tax=Desulfovulcanus ferrireducens TaxID=2831190 RepID=UPI00207BB855|nr:diadenylate cyclase CdaA [Desulfovulcanus ferrireducens]MBT8764433.1 diadenylate cyclase CdaA [Desulfovulcanus ferrireducens]
MLQLSLGDIQISWRDIIDIIIVAYLFYRLILLVKGTRAVSVIYGLLLILIAYYLAGELGLYTLHWLLANFLGSIFLVVIILFQRDIRKALAAMGAGRLWRRSKLESEVLDELVLALVQMARKRIGALVVIEKKMPLGDIIERGVEVKAKFSKELLQTIFYPGSPLHDGAVIIRGNTIEAAACILPLAVGVTHRSDWGTRHRAAMGITEDSDAIAVVISEERGSISVAIGGKLTSSLDEIRLRRVLAAAWEK